MGGWVGEEVGEEVCGDEQEGREEKEGMGMGGGEGAYTTVVGKEEKWDTGRRTCVVQGWKRR